MKIFSQLPTQVILLICLCLLVTASCQKEIDSFEGVESKSDADPVLERILKIGFSREHIIDKGQYYLVEGDIRFDKLPKSEKSAKVSHSINNSSPLVGFNKINAVTITVDNSFPNATWRQNVINGVIDAAASWSNVPPYTLPNRVRISYVNGPADITVRYNASYGAGEYALASWPNNCNPGPTIDINSQTQVMNRSRLQFLIAHEVGHTLGLGHTDFGTSFGWQVAFTPVTENGSIMNSGGAWGSTNDPNTVPQWPGFSLGDRKAVEALYTEYPVDAAYVEGNLPNNQKTIGFYWTVGYYCSLNVRWEVFKNGQSYLSPAITSNDGKLNFSGGSGTYRIVVYDISDPNRKSEDTIVI